MAGIKGNLLKGGVRFRDFSEPLAGQRESTGYGERLISVASFEPTPMAGDLAQLENEYVKAWRGMARNPYIDFAIDDVVNEMVSVDEDIPFPVSLQLDETEFSDKIREIIHAEFVEVLKLMQFQKKSYTLLRDWYIDGRQFFYVEFHGNTKLGIKEITPLDPLRTKKVVEDGKEFFVYQDIDITDQVLKIDPMQMVEVYSGLMDDQHRIWISYLHKASVPMNQLVSLEDAIVIYRLSRAPERRVFYVDVGELPKSKAEAYMKEIIANYRNKMEYNPETGLLREKVKFSSLLDDVWLPRRDGSRGTEVTTLQGGQNLGQLDDLDYFLKKLFRALNVPYSRFHNDGAANILGRTAEISRDEVKYTKFISRMRGMYNTAFFMLLRKQLVAKNIIDQDEFDANRDAITVLWNTDGMFQEFKQMDMLTERVNAVDRFMPHVGKLVSLDWIRRELLHFSDEDIEKMRKEIASEQEEYKEILVGPGAETPDIAMARDATVISVDAQLGIIPPEDTTGLGIGAQDVGDPDPNMLGIGDDPFGDEEEDDEEKKDSEEKD